jgi:hypothetical protein
MDRDTIDAFGSMDERVAALEDAMEALVKATTCLLDAMPLMCRFDLADAADALELDIKSLGLAPYAYCPHGERTLLCNKCRTVVPGQTE